MLGAAASASQVARHADVASSYPAVARSARLIGSLQVQNRASLGGNICNAAPSADAVPALICHQASVRIAGPNGAREELLEAFVRGPGKTNLATGRAASRRSCCRRSHRDRQRHTCASPRAARWTSPSPARPPGCVSMRRAGSPRRAVVLASVGPTPLRAASAEQHLARRTPGLRPVRCRRPARGGRCTPHLRHARLGRLPPLAGRRADGACAGRVLRGAARGAGIGMKTLLTCTVNGQAHTVLADTRDTLLDLLRERIGLTGTKEGCGNGNCGTCTVILDGAAVNACLVLALEAPGPRHRHHRRPVAAREAAPDPAGARRARRHAMRLLHAGHRAVRQGAARRQPQPHGAGRAPRHCRQHLSLHRLRQDRRCRSWPPPQRSRHGNASVMDTGQDTSQAAPCNRSASGCRASMPASA